MITVRLKGGMGNQMFQYALGMKLASVVGTDMDLDLTALLDRSRKDIVPRDFDLPIFKVEERFAVSPDLLRTVYKPKSSLVNKWMRRKAEKGKNHVKEKQFKYDASLVKNAKDNSLYEGWFQSYKYFDGIEGQVREAFSFKQGILDYSKGLLDDIRSSNSVCLNVRRTDFLKVDNLNTTNLDYFLRGADYMLENVENPHFFIFSDDVEWCRENIKFDAPIQVVGHDHKGERFGNYMQLMKACKNYIIPNSSFAWWAVWLNENKDKIVIAPKRWFNDTSIDTSDLIPADWLRM